MLAIYYNMTIQTNPPSNLGGEPQPGRATLPTTERRNTMTDNEKMIESINHYLPKLTEKQLRLVLILLYSFTKNSPQAQEATN